MTTLPDPPLTSSILAYNPFFPNGIVSDAWGAYFTALSSIIIAGPVESFNGRTGAVVPASGDYPASLIPFTPAGTGAVASTVDAKLKQTVSVFDFMTGAQITAVQANSAVQDSAAAIAAAITSLGSNGGDVIFPPGTFNLFSGGIVVPANVNLIGQGGKIIRMFQYDNTKVATTTQAFILYGNNIIKDIWYDGNGWSASVFPGVQGQDYTFYQDWSPAPYPGTPGYNYQFLNCKFFNAPGSFITPSGYALSVVGCSFTDWRDHCIYIGEASANTQYDIAITGNEFNTFQSSPFTTRDPIKLKGNLSNISVTGNTFNIPNLANAILDISAIYNTEHMGFISITGNTVSAGGGYFVNMYNGDDNTRYLDSVVISGNTVQSTYFVFAGARPTNSSVQNGVRIKHLVIANNVSRGSSGVTGSSILINGKDGIGHNGIETLDLIGNTLEVGSFQPLFLGNIQSLNIRNNTFVGLGGDRYALSFGIANDVTYSWKAGTTNTSFTGSASIVNNTLIAISHMIDETGADATHPSVIGLDVYVDGNRFVGTNASPSARTFVSTNLTYFPTTTLTIGPSNTAAPLTGAIAATPFVWGGTIGTGWRIRDTTAGTALTSAAIATDGGICAAQQSTFIRRLTVNSAGLSGQPLDVGTGGGSYATMRLLSTAGVTRDLEYNTGGTLRWAHGVNTTAEGGSDAGSDFFVKAYTDAGASIDNPVVITRASAGPITLGGSTQRPVTITGGLTASSFATVPQGTTSGTVDYTGATDSTANLQAILDAAAQGTVVWLKPGTPKFNVILRKNGVSLMGSGMAQFTGSTTSYWQPFDVTKPVVTISDDLAVYNGCSVVNALLYTPSGTGQKGLVFAGGAQKCYAKNIMSLGFTKSCIEFRNDDVNPCTFNAADTIFASTNVVGANGISYIDNHVAGTGYTTACEVSNFSTTAPNGYPVYCESAQTNSLSNGYIQTSYSGHGIYFKKTSSEVYYPRLNFSNVDVDNVSGYGTVSTVLDIAGTYPSNYRSATDVANLSPIMGELNTAANSYWAAGHTTLSANFTVAATTITLTSVAGLEAGMHIMIPGAGASGRNYFDQIVSISGSVVTLSQHNSSTQVNSGGDVSWGDIVNAVDTRGVLSSFSNGAIVVGATNKDGVTGDGAGLIYQSNGAGQGYWSSGDFISEWKDKQFRFLGSVSSPSVTAISRVGTTVTVTTSSAHKMGVGDPFALSGIVDADGFNSTTQWQPTVASVGSSTTFTYTSLVSGSTTPANQNPTLVPYRGMHFNRGRLEFDNGTGSGIGFKVAAGTMGAAIFTDNINPTLNIWTPDTTNGTYDFRWGSSISTGKAMRIGNNSVGDRAYLTGNGAWWLLNAAAPATDSGGSFIYAATADNRMHIKDASGNDGAILTTTDQVGTFTTAAPTGTTSATAVMMGLGGSATITPKNSTRLLIMATFQAANSTLNDGITCDLRFGTGTAPTNGAAVTGTLVGIAQTRTSLVAADRGGMVLCGIATGLTLGTAYWLDVSALAVTGGTASITGVTVTAHEI